MTRKEREIRKMSWELIMGSASATGILYDPKWVISYVISIKMSRRIQTLVAQS